MELLTLFLLTLTSPSYSSYFLVTVPDTIPSHFFLECIVERNAIELAVFHAAASFVCRLRKSIVRADTLRKEASLSAGASAAAQPGKRAE